MAKRRKLRRRSLKDASRRLQHETLEQRQLLAALLGVNPNSGELINLDGSTVLSSSPTELTMRFDGGEQLRADTLDGIRLVRSGGDGEFGAGSPRNDVTIQPGYVGFTDADETAGEQGRVVTMRFAQPLPDDDYQLEIYAFDDPNAGITGLRSGDGEFFEPSNPNADREIIPFEIELGAQVISVVPQPVLRDTNGVLNQRRDQVVVYFNDDDLIAVDNLPSGRSTIRTSDVTSGALPTAIDPNFYQMILTRETVSGNDDVVVVPTEVEYSPTLDRAVLTFGADQNGAAITSLGEIAVAAGVSDGDGTFRLKIGRNDTVGNETTPIRPTTKNLLSDDLPSSFDTSATSFDASLGSLNADGIVLSEQIRANDTYTLPYPGGPTEPGQRDIALQQHVYSPFGDYSDGGSERAISTLYYNFNTSIPYGVSDNGQLLFNAITERQKERVREIYEQLGNEWGVDFVETESHVVDGVEGASLTIVLGDLVVFGGFGGNNTSGPGGVYGGVAQSLDNGFGQAHTFGRRIALLDRAELWYNGPGTPELADSRLSFYAHTMAVVGTALGVGTASDLPPGTVMSGLLSNITLGGERDLLTYNPIEPSLPGDHDTVHGQYLYRPESRDIDVYNFTVDPGETGVFTAEVFAERLHGSASLLDSRIALYDSDGVLRASNDDYFGEDSFLKIPLSEGDYYLAVSASGNDQFDLNVIDSGTGGTSEGRYDILMNFRPDASTVIVDTSGTAFDGDGDGLAGGSFNYWFRAVSDVGNTTPNPSRPRTLFVDKTPRATPPAGTVLGTLTDPYGDVQSAFAAARPGDIVRLVGNAGIDGDMSTRNDSYAYEVGRGGSLNAPLSDGVQMDVPAGVHVMVEAGAIFKLRDSRIGVGSSTTSVDRSGSSLQVLGTPFLNDAAGNPLVDNDGQPVAGSVIFTSYNDENTGVDTNPLTTVPRSGNWGGIEFRNDIDRAEGRFDYELEGIFLNHVGMADIRYGGGQVNVDSEDRVINPIHMSSGRPTLLENVITLSADAAISADPNSFEETNFNAPRYQQNDTFTADYQRVGPDIRGNTLLQNSTNGLFIRVDTEAGEATDVLTVAARFDDRDIVHFVGDSLIVQGTPGGPKLEQRGPAASGIQITTQSPPSGESSSLQSADYTYRLTFVDAFGGESVPSDATAAVTPGAGQQITLANLPVASGDFVSRRIYRSEPGGGGPFTLVADLDRSSLQFVDRGQSKTATLAGTSATAEAGANALSAGTYYYRVTLVDNDVPSTERLVSQTPISVDVAAGEVVRLSDLPGNYASTSPGWEQSNDRTVSRRIYRSTDGINFQRVGQTSLLATEFVDDATNALGTNLPNGLPTVSVTRLRGRPDARLAIDAAVIVKFEGTRIETGFGAQLIAEGQNGQPVVFTSRADDRYGAGGTFDTNNDAGATQPQPGDWGGLYIAPKGSVSLDHALVTFGGGEVASGGAFAGFNALEIIEANARVTNSTFERNASGMGSGQGDDQRDGHGFNEPATIFIRDAQPVIVGNIIRDNVDNAARTAAISIDVNSLNSTFVTDTGRQTGRADRFDRVLDNQGPLINGNLIGNNSLNGLAIRGGTLTTESVWDDTDIVHVLANQRPDLQINELGQPVGETILIPDFHTYGGLRMESGATQSLVVKFDDDASIVANGRPLEIEDRIGGILQVLGKPGFPVVLTSLSDDEVGAGFDPEGLAQTDTNGDGPSTGAPGDWAGLLLDQFSHDRNVVTLTELESPRQNARPDSVVNNGTPANAQFLGSLATGEKTSDDNLRLGYTVKGFINRPADVDVYSFRGTAGTEVWLDIDRTSPSLDTIVELVASDGSILALSDNSHRESLGGTTLLANSSLLPPGNVNVMQKDPFGTLAFGDLSFLDHYTVNQRDAGMRVVLPGAVGATSTYFVRVRSSSQDPASPTAREITDKNAANYEGNLLTQGNTAGNYELQIRLRETQEQGGSTVRYSDIRYATDGITVRGLPKHSPLLGEAAEDFDSETNDTLASAPDLGALNASDRGALSVSGQLASRNDLDWYQFRLEPDSVDPLISDSFSTPVILDIDHADGIARPNTSLWLFNSDGELISFGTDSNIADDQPGPNQGVDQDDLSRGSAGPLDAWIGSLQLTGGDYYVAVSNNSVISDQISQFQLANVSAAQALVRVEPVSSVTRISSDHDFDGDGVQDFFFIDPFTGEALPLDDSATASPPLSVAFDGNGNRIDYTLGDVVLFVSRDNGSSSLVETYNPFTGALQSVVSQTAHVNDVTMRPDGRLYGIEVPTGGARNDGTTDDVFVLDTARNGGSTQVGDTGIQTFEVNPDNGDAAQAFTNNQGGDPPPRNGDGMTYDATTFIGASGNSSTAFSSANDLAMLAVSRRYEAPLDSDYEGNWIYRLDPSSGAGVSAPFNNRTGNGRLSGAGTQVVERGFLATDQDNSANATTAVLNTGVSSLANDGETVMIQTVLAENSRFEFDQGLPATVSSSVLSYATDGDVISFTDSFGHTVALEIDFGVQLHVDSPGTITDGDTFTLGTSSGTEFVFEFDKSSTPDLFDINHIRVAHSANAATLASNIVAAVNGLGISSFRGVTAATDPTRIDFIGDGSLDIVGVTGLSPSGAYGTTTGTPVPVNAAMSAAEFVQAIAETLNSGDSVNSVGVPHTIGAVASGLNIRFAGPDAANTAPSWLQIAPGISTTVSSRFDNTIADGDTLELEDAGGNSVFVEFDLGVMMTVGDTTAINDGDTFEITDINGDTTTFEFDVVTNFGAPSGVGDPSHVEVTIVASSSSAAVAEAIVAAVNGSSTPLTASQRPRGGAEIDFVNDTLITHSLSYLTLSGNYGAPSHPLSVSAAFSDSPEQIATRIAALLDGSPAVNGIDASMVGTSDTLNIINTNAILSSPLWLSQLGTRAPAFPIGIDPSETAEELAARLVTIFNNVSTGFDASAYGNTVALYGVNSFLVSSSTAPFELAKTPGGGTITGLTTVDISGSPRVYAVSDQGDLFEVVSGSFGGSFSLSSSSNISDYIATIHDDLGNPLTFTGLEAGPRNIYGGELSTVLFGITDDGDIYAFDTKGRPQGVFMHGQRSISTGVSDASGLAFSNLDVNLWHVTSNRGGDAGHGVNSSPDDNERRFPPEPAGSSNQSLYFGMEDPDQAGNSLGDLFQGALDFGDTGIVGDYAGSYATYDFPGGAHGTMESNPLDLSAYAREDRPTLYFNYYLETENSNSDLSDGTSSPEGNMLDAFRIFAAGEDGFWKLIGTNNSDSDRLTGNHDEYQDEFDQTSSGGSELVQELFDVGDDGAPDSWRQARIPLDDFAGEKQVRIRIDFSTAGSSALGHPFLGGEELRAKSGSSIEGGSVLTLQRVEPGFGGATTLYDFEFDFGLDLHVPSGANLNDGDFFWVDNQKYTFVTTASLPPGSNQILFSATDSAATITQRILAEMQRNGLYEGDEVFVDPERPNAINIPAASSGYASVGLPSTFIASLPGVAAGNLPIHVNHAMTSAEVAAAVTASFAEHLNDAGSRGNTQPYQVSNGYMIHLYGHRVLDPGPLGLSRHGIEVEPYGFSLNGDQGTDFVSYTQRLPGDEFGRFATSSRTSPGSIRGENNAFEGVYLDDIIIGFRERGEMVTDAVGDLTSFAANNEYEPELQGGSVDEVERGLYQLEIRRGPTYGQDTIDGGVEDFVLRRNFDTNYRFNESVALVAPIGAVVGDGQTFTVSDGTDVATFEFDDVTLPDDNPNVGVASGSGHVLVPFDPRMTASEIGRLMRDAINTTAQQTNLDVTASMSDGADSDAITSTGRVSTSSLVYLHGVAAASRDGSFDFGDLNNNGDNPGLRRFFNDDVIRFAHPLFDDETFTFFNDDYRFRNLGDENVFRDQGQLLISQNTVSHSLNFGISIIPGVRDVTSYAPLAGELPQPGPVRSTLEYNQQRLATSVTVFNNVLHSNLEGGIEVLGESDAAGGSMEGSVPFARIVNNTIFGGDANGNRIADVGIRVADNASPTLLNNIVANLGTGVAVDASSSTTVIGTMLYHANGTNSTFLGGNLGAFPLTVGANESLFLNDDPSTAAYNFYLADGSAAIDSSLNSLVDRDFFVNVKAPLGIGASPIIAPSRDLTGQLRVDDPLINTPGGIGQNVFVDRGAIDRSDFGGPSAALLNPQDNDLDGQDLDASVTFVQVKEGTIEFFELVLVENQGTGPDASTVTADSVTLTENGQLLVEGVDYTFGFSATNRTIRLTPLSGIWNPDAAYELTLNNRDRLSLTASQSTSIVDEDRFTITDTSGVTATFEYDTGYVLQVPQSLMLTVPIGQDAAGFQDGDLFSITAPNGNQVTFEIATIDRSTGANTRVLITPGDPITAVRDAIFTAIESQSDVGILDLAPRKLGNGQIQIGSLSGHSIDPMTTPLIQSGTAGTVIDGTITYQGANGDEYRIELDSDGIAAATPGDVVVSYERTATPAELAADIAAAFAASPLNLGNARALEDGLLSIGGASGDVIDLTEVGLTTQGTPGVTGPLQLTLPADSFSDSYEGQTLSVSDGSKSITYEFTLDSNRLPGTQLIILQPGQDAATVTARLAQAIAADFTRLSPQIQSDGTLVLSEPVGSSVDTSNTQITVTGVAGGAIPIDVLPSAAFNRNVVAAQLLAAISASPLNTVAFVAGGGKLLLDNTVSVVDQNGNSLTEDLVGIKDLAGNDLLPNRSNQETQFTILMPGVELDFGDASQGSPGLSYERGADGALNAARHTLSDSRLPRLGALVNADLQNAFPGSDDGDDGVLIATPGIFIDPDGDFLGFLNPLATTGTELMVDVSGSGLLDAWIDFNQDGDWNDPGEQVFSNTAVLPGLNQLRIQTPSSAFEGDTWARFRISPTGNQTPQGVVIGGEVEDYQVFVARVAPPVPVNDSDYVTLEENTLNGTSVLANDTLSPDLSNQRAQLVDDVKSGTLVLNDDGTFVYTPDPDFNGTDTFTYRIAGDTGTPPDPTFDISSNEVATVTITVTPVNDAPLFVLANPTTPGNASLDVLEQDAGGTPYNLPFATNVRPGPATAIDEADQTISFTVVPDPANPAGLLDGPLVVDSNGRVIFTPAADAIGTAVFTITAVDSGSSTPPNVNVSSPVTLTINVRPVNDPPRIDPTVVGTSDMQSSDDAYSVDAAGQITYVLREDNAQPTGSPAAPYVIDLRSTVGAGYNRIGLLDVFNAGPANEEDNLAPGGGQTIRLSSFDGVDTLTTALGGTLAADRDGNGDLIRLLYTPPTDANSSFRGFDSFDYTVSDDGQTWQLGTPGALVDDPLSATNTVFLQLQPVNDVPQFNQLLTDVRSLEDLPEVRFQFADAVTAGPQLTATDETDSVTGQNVSFLVEPLDAANAAIAATLFGANQPQISADGTLRYTAAPDQVGTATFNVTLLDDGAEDPTRGDVRQSQTVQLTITVEPRNDAPLIDPAVLDTPLTVNPADADDAYSVDGSGQITYVLREDNTQAGGVTPPFVIDLRDTSGAAYGRIGLEDVFLPGPAEEVVTQSIRVNTFDSVDTVTTELGGTLTAERDLGGNLVRLLYVPPTDLNSNLRGPDSFTYSVIDNGQTWDSDTGVLFDDFLTANNRVFLQLNPANDAPQFNQLLTDVTSLEDQPVVRVQFAESVTAGSPLTAIDETDLVSGQNLSFLVEPVDAANAAMAATLFGANQPQISRDGTLSYTAAPDQFGSVTFNVTLLDDGAENPARGDLSRSQTVPLTITVQPQNDTPVFANNLPVAFELDEDSSILIPYRALPGEPQGMLDKFVPGPPNEVGGTAVGGNQTLSLGTPILASTVSRGTLTPVTINGRQFLRYTPRADFNGTDSFAYSVVDDGVSVDVDGNVTVEPKRAFFSVTLDVQPVNDSPQFGGASDVSVDEDAGENDPQVPPADVGLTVIPQWATNIQPGPPGAVDEAQTQTVTFTVTPASAADAALAAQVFVADNNGDPDVAVDSQGTLRFRTLPHANGSVTFRIVADDNSGEPLNTSPAKTFTISVRPVNDPPTFTPGPLVVAHDEDSGTYSAVWATDISAGPFEENLGAQTVRFDVTIDPADAGLFQTVPTIDDSGVLRFVPASNANGTATVMVQAIDSAGGVSTPLPFDIEIVPVIDTPTAVDDTFDIDEDTVRTLLREELLDNDVDPDLPDDTLTISLVSSVTRSGASVTLDSNNNVVYDPTQSSVLQSLAPNQTATDTFSYVLTDAFGRVSQPAVVSVVVSGVNDAPRLLPDNPDVQPTGSTILRPLDNDSDIDGTLDVSTLEITLDPAFGSVTLPGDGTIVYTPYTGFRGTDTLRYTVKDDRGEAGPETLISILANQAPVADDDRSGTFQNEAIDIDVLANDSDPDGDDTLNPNSIVILRQPSSGTAFSLGGGLVRYVPADGFNGDDSFTYTVSDNLGRPSQPATVRVQVVSSRAQNPLNNMDVSGDGGVSPIDALLNVNLLNRLGSLAINNAGVWQADQTYARGDIVQVGEQSWLAEGTPTVNEQPGPGTVWAEVGKPFYDVDGNRRIEPLDVLTVVNELNRRSRQGRAGGQGEAAPVVERRSDEDSQVAVDLAHTLLAAPPTKLVSSDAAVVEPAGLDDDDELFETLARDKSSEAAAEDEVAVDSLWRRYR